MKIRLMLGDCLNRMAEIADGSIDLILADLPYGTTACKWDSVIPFGPLWAHYRRLIKPRGAIVLTASQPFTSALVMSNPKWFRHEWIWRKNRGSNFANTVREPMKEHESALVFSEGGWTYNKQMEDRRGGGLGMGGQVQKRNVRDSDNYAITALAETILTEQRVPSSVQEFNCEVGFHPTQKPVGLFEYLIRTYSDEGETVLDNTMGSGTTVVAAVNTNRDVIGIERDPAIYATAHGRIMAHIRQQAEADPMAAYFGAVEPEVEADPCVESVAESA